MIKISKEKYKRFFGFCKDIEEVLDGTIELVPHRDGKWVVLAHVVRKDGSVCQKRLAVSINHASGALRQVSEYCGEVTL